MTVTNYQTIRMMHQENWSQNIPCTDAESINKGGISSSHPAAEDTGKPHHTRIKGSGVAAEDRTVITSVLPELTLKDYGK